MRLALEQHRAALCRAAKREDGCVGDKLIRVVLELIWKRRHVVFLGHRVFGAFAGEMPLADLTRNIASGFQSLGDIVSLVSGRVPCR